MVKVSIENRKVGEKTFVNVRIEVMRGERGRWLDLDPRDVGALIDDLGRLAPQALEAQDKAMREARGASQCSHSDPDWTRIQRR